MKKQFSFANFITVIFFVIALAERFFRLLELPYGIHADEAGMAYDAYCLANYGVDRYLNHAPVYLRNFGGGQSALYAYLTAGLFKVFGYSTLVYKLPGILFSLLTLLFGARIVKKLIDHEWAVAAYTVLFAIAPYFLMSSRIAVDCNLMLGLSTAFLFCFMEATEKESTWRYVVSGILAGLTLYTYALSYLVLPFFLLASLVYLICMKKITLKNGLLFSLPIVILAVPLLIEQYVNLFDKETLHILGLTFPKLMYRVGEFTYPGIQRLIATLKVAFLFDGNTLNSYPKYMVLYPVSVPFAIVGIYATIRNLVVSMKNKQYSCGYFVIVWLLGELLVGSMIANNEVTVNRLNAIYFAMAFFVVEGFFCLWKAWKTKRLRILYVAATVLLYAICVFGFYRYYFVKVFDANVFGPQSNPDFTDAFAYMENELNPDGEKTIYMGNEAQNYIYYCISTLPDPHDIDIEAGATKDGKISFYLSSTLDPNGIYLVYKQPEYQQWLENSDYIVEQYEGFAIAYRN